MSAFFQHHLQLILILFVSPAFLGSFIRSIGRPLARAAAFQSESFSAAAMIRSLVSFLAALLYGPRCEPLFTPRFFSISAFVQSISLELSLVENILKVVVVANFSAMMKHFLILQCYIRKSKEDYQWYENQSFQSLYYFSLIYRRRDNN